MQPGSPIPPMLCQKLVDQVVLFCDFLKSCGFGIFLADVIDTLRSLEHIDILHKDDFFSALRAGLVKNDTEWSVFDRFFKEFWDAAEPSEPPAQKEPLPEPVTPLESPALDRLHDRLVDPGAASVQGMTAQTFNTPAGYSPVATVAKKSMTKFKNDEIQIAQLILKKMISSFRIDPVRRFKKHKRSSLLDFRRMIRKCIKSGGIPPALIYKKKKKRLKRLVVLADVSGSMERYGRFILPFILGLKAIGSKAKVFAFSTTLTAITPVIRRLPYEKALATFPDKITDWSGGTKIGRALQQFNRDYADGLSRKRTIILFISDGWDLGSNLLLEKEMEALKRKAGSMIWLNPLASELGYRPPFRGMETVMPYVDHFLPAENLQALNKLSRILAKEMS